MSPPIFSEELLLQCEKQTEFLFYQFLKISSEYDSGDELQRDSLETKEVDDIVAGTGRSQHARIRPLSGNESFSFGHVYLSNPENRPRTPTHDIEHDYEVKRRSREIPGSPKTASISGLVRDNASLLPRSTSGFEVSQPGRVHPADPYSEPRVVEIGPTEQQLCETALKIAQVGDKIDKEYEGRLARLERDLVGLIGTAGSTLTYELFAAHVNELVGQDRSWRNFVFILHLSKKVLEHSGDLTSRFVDFFRRFIAAAFREEVAAQRNVVQYVESGVESL